MKKSLILPLAVFCALTVFGLSKDGEAPWGKIDDSLVTPHRKFASPAAGEKVKVLITAPGIGQRELVELKQRFEYDYVLLTTFNFKLFSPFPGCFSDTAASKEEPLYAASMNAKEYKAALDAILEKLPECNAIIVGKLKFESFPKEVADKILARVKAGAGLILIGFDGISQSVPGVEFANTPAIDFPTDAIPRLQGVRLKEGALGKGRIMTITYKATQAFNDAQYVEPLTPFESDDPLYYDYCHAFLGKCIWYLTQPERAIIASVDADGKVVLKKDAPAGSMLDYEIVDRFGGIVGSGSVKAEKETLIRLPELPGSARMLDVRLKDSSGKVIDYQSAAVNPGRTIDKLELPRDGWKPDEAISATLKLSREFKGDIAVMVRDNFGKVIYEGTINASGMEIPFEIKILHQKSSYGELAVKLTDGDRLVDEARADVFFDTSKDVSDFAFGMWGYAVAKSRPTAVSMNQMSKAGVDNMMDAAVMSAPAAKYREAPRTVKKAGMNYAIYITRLIGTNPFREGRCHYSSYPEYRKSGSLKDAQGIFWDHDPSVTAIAEGARHLGVLFYNLGDENFASMTEAEEGCFCPACRTRFQEYLEKEYGTFENLNKEYGSNYKEWSEITPLPFLKAAEQNKMTMWLDFRLFMEEQYIDWHRYTKAKIQAVDPQGRCGIEGMVYPHCSFTGFNLYKMLPYFEFCAPYYNLRDAHALKYMPQGGLKSAWFGSYEGQMGRQFVQMPPWRYLFGGLGGAFYWFSGEPQGCGAFSKATIFGPDLRLLDQFTYAAKEIKTIKDSGLGKLLLNSKTPASGVFVHYSNNSLHASTINPDKTSWEISHKEFGALLESLGIPYEFLSPPELEKGIPANAKMLILPYSQALSAKEAENIREFVKNGGLVVTDFSPGIMDQHGKFLDKSRLADVFGKFEKMNISKFGKGHAVYLQDYLSGIDSRIQKNEALGLQNGMLRIFELGGVKPFASVKDDAGKIQPVSLFAHGTSRYICMLAQKTEIGETRKGAAGAEAGTATDTSVDGSFSRTVKLEKPMYVYDVLKGNKFLGKTDTFTVTLEPATGRVLACLEAPAKAPTLEVVDKKISRGAPVNFKIGRIDNAVILTVTGPDGKVADEQRLTVSDARFVAAYSDPAGKYTATVKDVVSGLSTSAKFKVKK